MYAEKVHQQSLRSRASATTSSEELRAIFELRQARRGRRAQAPPRHQKRHRQQHGRRPLQSHGETPERAAAQAGAQTRARLAARATQAAQEARAAMTAAATTEPKTIRSLGADPHR